MHIFNANIRSAHMKAIVYQLFDGDLAVSDSAQLYYEARKNLPEIIKNAVTSSLKGFAEFLSCNAHIPSEYFSRQNFADIGGSSERPLREIFGQISASMSVFLLKDADLSVLLKGRAEIARYLGKNFSYAKYRTKCRDLVINPLNEMIEKYVSAMDFAASIASRQVDYLQNKESGIIGTIYNGVKQTRIESKFCEKCDEKFFDCAQKAEVLTSEKLSSVITELAMESLVVEIGEVGDGLDIVQYQKAVQRMFAKYGAEEGLRDAMRQLPFEPLVIRRALSKYGDNGNVISDVASHFGVNVEAEKVSLLNEIVQDSGCSDEKMVCHGRAVFEQKVLSLSLKEESSIVQLRSKLHSISAQLDKEFRTVSNVIFPTRLEAARVRNDCAFLKDVMGEDVLAHVVLMSRDPSVFRLLKDALPFARPVSVDIVVRCSEILSKIEERKIKSPYLCLVERALAHVRDFANYAGNNRFVTDEEAKIARASKRKILLEAFRNSSNKMYDFKIEPVVFLKLKARGVISFFSNKAKSPVEDYIEERFLGDMLPPDVRTVRDVLNWQLGFDYFDPDEASFVEISESGLPKGCVSLSNYEEGDGFAIFDDLDAETEALEFSLEPYRRAHNTTKNIESVPLVESGQGVEECAKDRGICPGQAREFDGGDC